MKEDKKLFTQQAELLLTVLNQQRHDWLNHFQVLLGYLKLGRPDAGEAYLKRVTEETLQESMIARLQCPPLSVFFLTYNALNHVLRLEVEVCNDVDLSSLTLGCDDFCQLVIDYVDVIENHVKEYQLDCPNLLISLITDEESVTIKFDLAAVLSTSAAEEMEKLTGRCMNYGAVVCESIHNEEEWILALRFPFHEEEFSR